MIKHIYIISVSLALLISNVNLIAQPLWNNTIGFSNDSLSRVAAVKVAIDNTQQIYVLTNYSTPIAQNVQENKIILNKYNNTGALLWSFTFDNQGLNNVRSFDMRIDGSNNVYIVGGRIVNSQFSLLFFKVSMNGSLSWVKFGNTGFDTDYYTNIEFRNNLFYLRSNAGVAVYNQNGIEQYVISQYNGAFDVDYSGRIVLSAYINNNNLIRYTASGAIDFMDSTLQADKILCDYTNEIFLVRGQIGMSSYGLAKHDSNGQFQWSMQGLPTTPPFGDWNYGIMATGQNEYILYGIADSMIKFNQAGQILWQKNMNGMDDSQISGKIIGNGFLLFTGSINGFAGSDVVTKIFDTNGTEVWSQLYNGSFTGGDWGVDVDADSDGIYVVSQLEDSTNLMKYLSPLAADSVDFSQVCVDSVWIGSDGFVHVNVFNGNFSHMNYPAINIVSSAGDTVSLGSLSFFAQLGNSYQEYTNTITDTTISDFSNYSFFIKNSFNPDTIAQINFCTTTGIERESNASIQLFPNPADQFITFVTDFTGLNESLIITDVFGREIINERKNSNNFIVETQSFSEGIYLIKIVNGKNSSTRKFVISR
ncbi:MAG: T9SS type A sorting domain-containing protein [Bacteroidota bacterium]